MSIQQEGAKVASGLIDALRSQPMLLAIIVLNAAIFLIIYWSVSTNRQLQHEVMLKLVEQNAKSQELLSRCIVPQQRGELDRGEVRLTYRHWSTNEIRLAVLENRNKTE